MRQFKKICADFGVLESNVSLIATEATRSAINSEEFLEEIETHLGWKARVLAQPEEARLGAMGVASSVDDPANGIVMDMGGGSLQMSLMEKTDHGRIFLRALTSWPFGAAALQAAISSQNLNFRNQFETRIGDCFNDFMTEHSFASKMPREGYSLFLSGGGFRGWGQIMMTLDATQPYPISIANGYQIQPEHLSKDFPSEDVIQASHRISKRRAKQVSGVRMVLARFLAVTRNLGIHISGVTVCQGGVREGVLYEALDDSVRSEHALDVATSPYSPPSSSILLDILISALPLHSPLQKFSPSVIHLLYYHASYPKDIRATAALRCTTTGVIANVHGLSHQERAIMALILCERWGGSSGVPVSDQGFYDDLQRLISRQMVIWWTKYIGRILAGIASLYPSGKVHEQACTIELRERHLGKEHPSADHQMSIDVVITVLQREALSKVKAWKKKLKAVGDERKWIGGSNDFCGYFVTVDVICAFSDTAEKDYSSDE